MAQPTVFCCIMGCDRRLQSFISKVQRTRAEGASIQDEDRGLDPRTCRLHKHATAQLPDRADACLRWLSRPQPWPSWRSPRPSPSLPPPPATRPAGLGPDRSRRRDKSNDNKRRRGNSSQGKHITKNAQEILINDAWANNKLTWRLGNPSPRLPMSNRSGGEVQ